MAKIDMAYFENTISEVFHGGECLSRELRLTADEADYLCSAYPHAAVIPMDDSGGDKAWYLIQFTA